MNNIEAMKDTLETIKEQIIKSSEELNSALAEMKIKNENFNNAILKIEKQVESAEKKFTIAFVGTFNTGKSTIINSLLNLKGDARLSCEDDPDTARCIRIVERTGQPYEAEVDFGSDYETEQLSWIEAKKYTSQAALDKEDEAVKKRALMIKEVRYYVQSPLLRRCNILDLPGTGTGNHDDHTAITDEKIMESDCFFWVLSTDMEPNMESIKNLKKIRHKLLPIINVWKFENEDIEGEFSPEEIIKFVNDGYSEYLINADNPIIYYAKEIDYAQLNGLDIKDEWGKENFINKLDEIISNVQDGDRAQRIKNNILDALSDCCKLLENVKDSSEIKELRSSLKNNSTEINMQYNKLGRYDSLVSNDIRDTSKRKANEILDIIANASESFIQNKMNGVDFRHFLKVFTKKQQDKISKEFEDEFKKNYLKFDSGWFEKAVEEYCDDVIKILKSRYIDFFNSLINEEQIKNKEINPINMTGFINTIASQIQKDFQSKYIAVIASAVTIGILLAIPGLNILDSIASIYAVGTGIGNFADDSKLKGKINMIIVQSKVQIRQQQYKLTSELNEEGNIIRKDLYTKVEKELNNQEKNIETELGKLKNIDNLIQSFENLLYDAKCEMNDLIR